MPELPEVETIARALREGGRAAPENEPDVPVVGRTIESAEVLWDRTVAEPAPATFRRRVAGQHILGVGRRGKYVVFDLSEEHMLVHLRMTGDLLVERAHTPYGAHHRLVLHLDGDLRLAFNDPRKFGRVWLLDDPAPVLGALGPEPLSPSFTPDVLHAMLLGRRRQLKPLLLDQAFVAGLGNIYADEALFRAQLHPLTPSNTLSEAEADRLWKAIRFVLQEGIRRNGTSIDWAYRGGDFQNQLQVYDRAGRPCPRCGAPIQRIVVGQRGTHLCVRCQPSQADSDPRAAGPDV